MLRMPLPYRYCELTSNESDDITGTISMNLRSSLINMEINETDISREMKSLNEKSFSQ